MQKKILFVLSHNPNPRVIKKIDSLINKNDVTVIYWNRFKYNTKFKVNKSVKLIEFSMKVPSKDAVRRFYALIKYYFLVKEVFNNLQPEFVHATNFDMLLILNRVLKKNIKTKVIYEIGDLGKYVFYENEKFITRKIYKKIASSEARIMNKRVDSLILTSKHFWDHYYSNFFSIKKTYIILNVPKKSLFKDYSKRQNINFNIGFIGSVRYYQNLINLIIATQGLKPEINVLIAGDGPDFNKVKEYINNRNITNVTLYGPYNYEKEIVNLYNQIDLVYSVYDSSEKNVQLALPNRLYEAINCEIPIIASKKTKLSEFIEKEEIGVTVDSNNIEDLSQAIKKIYLDKIYYEKLQKKMNLIKKNYQYEFYETKLFEIYQ